MTALTPKRQPELSSSAFHSMHPRRAAQNAFIRQPETVSIDSRGLSVRFLAESDRELSDGDTPNIRKAAVVWETGKPGPHLLPSLSSSEACLSKCRPKRSKAAPVYNFARTSAALAVQMRDAANDDPALEFVRTRLDEGSPEGHRAGRSATPAGSGHRSEPL